MQDLNDLYYFVQSVEHGGFAPASRAILVPKSLLSRRIAQLEDRLGVRLIQRSTRHFDLTEAGVIYYEHCRAMLVEAEAAQEAIDRLQATPRGIVRISCPVALLQTHVGRMVHDFMAEYPEVTVVLEATNRRVDILGERIDIAIRVRPPPIEDSEAVMRVLADRRQSLVASPELVRKFGWPEHPRQLSEWPSLGVTHTADAQRWVLYDTKGQEIAIPHTPRFATTDMVTLRDAAVAGLGVVQLPDLMVRDQLQGGTLVRLTDEWRPRREIIHAVFPTRRGRLPAVRLMLDHLALAFSQLIED